jgi:hypothetical protein
MSMPATAQEGPPRSYLHRVVDRARMVYIFGNPVGATFVKATDRSVTVYTSHRGQPAVSKYFARTSIGKDAFRAERATGDLFGHRPWRMPVLKWHRRGFTVPRLPEASRLDIAGQELSREERVDMGAWTLDVLLEIYLTGHLHGDLQPHNIWLLDGRPVVTDFETFGPRTPGIPFLDSGDITGNDPRPRDRSLDPAFDPEDDWSFHHMLGVSLQDAVDALRPRLVAAAEHSPDDRAKLEALDGVRT